MKNFSQNLSRIALCVIILFRIFGNLFPFLNIDFGFVILTPIRSVLAVASVYSFVLWILRFKKKESAVLLKRELPQWLFFAFFAVWFAAGAAWLVLGQTGSYAPTEVVGLLTLCLLAFCIFTLVRTREDIRFLLWLCAASGVLLAVLGCVEVVFGSFVPETKFYFTLPQKIRLGKTLFSPTTVFYNPNDFAAFMLGCLAIICFRLISAKTLREFSGALAAGVFIHIPTVLTNSTLFNLFSLALIFLTVLALLFTRGKTWKVRLTRVSVIALVTVLFMLVGVNAIRSVAANLNRSYYSARIEQYLSEEHPPLDDSDASVEDLPDILDLDSSDIENPTTFSEQLDANRRNYGTIHIRLWLIRAGLDFFADSPLLGCGPESFRENILQEETYLRETRGNSNPHFFYIELLSQYGVVIFAAYLAIILWLFIRSLILTFREMKNGQPDRGMLCLLLTGVFSVIIIMPSSTIRFSTIWLYPILAMSVLLKGQKTDNGNADP